LFVKFLNYSSNIDEVLLCVYDIIVKTGVTSQNKDFFRCIYEAGDEHTDADGAENDARSAYDTIDGDSPASNPCPSGKNRTGA
jgi:hypothetical protein